MIEADKISKSASKHILYCCYIMAVLYLVVLIFGSELLGDWFETSLVATSTAVIFALIECISVAKLWSWMAKSHRNSLTTFFMALSAVRIICFLLMLTIIFFIVGREKFIPFVIAFVVIYAVLLCYHSLFFTHMNKKIFDEPMVPENEEKNYEL